MGLLIVIPVVFVPDVERRVGEDLIRKRLGDIPQDYDAIAAD